MGGGGAPPFGCARGSRRPRCAGAAGCGGLRHAQLPPLITIRLQPSNVVGSPRPATAPYSGSLPHIRLNANRMKPPAAVGVQGTRLADCSQAQTVPSPSPEKITQPAHLINNAN